MNLPVTGTCGPIAYLEGDGLLPPGPGRAPAARRCLLQLLDWSLPEPPEATPSVDEVTLPAMLSTWSVLPLAERLNIARALGCSEEGGRRRRARVKYKAVEFLTVLPPIRLNTLDLGRGSPRGARPLAGRAHAPNAARRGGAHLAVAARPPSPVGGRTRRPAPRRPPPPADGGASGARRRRRRHEHRHRHREGAPTTPPTAAARHRRNSARPAAAAGDRAPRRRGRACAPRTPLWRRRAARSAARRSRCAHPPERLRRQRAQLDHRRRNASASRTAAWTHLSWA